MSKAEQLKDAINTNGLQLNTDVKALTDSELQKLSSCVTSEVRERRARAQLAVNLWDRANRDHT